MFTTGLLVLLLWLTMPPNLYARQESSTTIESEAEYTFGQVLRFSIRASSASPINKTTLFIQASELPNTLTAEIDTAPAKSISVNYEVDLTQLRLAPFTTITYWWLLEDEAGDSFESDRQTLEYIDDQFMWHRKESDGIQINWSGDEAAIGQAAEDAVLSSLPRIEAIIPIVRPDPLKVYVYPSAADLRAGLRLTGRDWVGAHARPELGVILVAANGPLTASEDLARTIPHELAHLYLYEATGDGHEGVPLWLDEGLAGLVEGAGSHPNYAPRLAEAIANGETFAFADLCYTLPSDEDGVLLAYAQSESFVRYIQSEYGNQALQHMIGELANGADCQSAPLRALDRSLTELNDEWLEHEMPQTILQRAWLNGRAWLLIIVAGFTLAVLLARVPRERHRRAR